MALLYCKSLLQMHVRRPLLSVAPTSKSCRRGRPVPAKPSLQKALVSAACLRALDAVTVLAKLQRYIVQVFLLRDSIIVFLPFYPDSVL